MTEIETWSPEMLAILKKYFIFDQVFALIDYDSNMKVLYDKLAKLKRDSYEPNYRFIFLHYDTEYYIAPDRAGLTLINLQKILQSLDISNYFCLILTQQNLEAQCQQVQRDHTIDDCSIASISAQLHRPCHLPIEDKNLNLNVDMISAKYLSLNKIPRFHRHALVALLKYKNLLGQGMVSYNRKKQYGE
jgi:hypothetical protein